LNRKNQVFTAAGTTDPYEVLTGIDQGEIISPLLWCIYYDPLLCQIQEEQFGYKITGKRKIDIYEQEISEGILFPGLAFMDDTTFITNTKESMEKTLSIADDFYLLNDIQINKGKSELILQSRKKDFNYKEKLQIKFGDQEINIKPKLPNESTRILGVWFNANNKKDFVKHQINDEVIQLCAIVKNKRITDKQLQYVFNTLIIPRVEYRSQVTVLSAKECNALITKFRKIFK
jgi:hypothetical protein